MLLNRIAVAGREYRIEIADWNGKVYISRLDGNGDEIDCACFDGGAFSDEQEKVINQFRSRMQKAAGEFLGMLDWKKTLEEQQQQPGYYLPRVS